MRKMLGANSMSSVVAMLALAGAAQADNPSYEVHPILLGESTLVSAMNESSAVVGLSDDGTMFRWTIEGGVEVLSGLAEADGIHAHAMNDVGQVVGKATMDDGESHAFHVQHDQALDIGLAEEYIYRTFLNDDDQIVANVTEPGYPDFGDYVLLHTDSGWADLTAQVPGSLYGMGEVAAINTSGQIAGHAPFVVISDDETVTAVFRYEPDGHFEVIAPLGGNDTLSNVFAHDMNSAGQITGKTTHDAALNPGDRIAYRYSDDEGMVGLPLPDAAVTSEGQKINDHGHVAGIWEDAEGVEHAFFYSDQTGLIDLGASHGVLDVVAMNNNDEILLSTNDYWSPETGLVHLQNVLTPEGIETGDLMVLEPVAINDDGAILLTVAEFLGYPIGPEHGALLEPVPGADVNEDGVVNVADLLQLLGTWGACDGCDEDLDQSGAVDVADLLILLDAWG